MLQTSGQFTRVDVRGAIERLDASVGHVGYLGSYTLSPAILAWASSDLGAGERVPGPFRTVRSVHAGRGFNRKLKSAGLVFSSYSSETRGAPVAPNQQGRAPRTLVRSPCTVLCSPTSCQPQGLPNLFWRFLIFHHNINVLDLDIHAFTLLYPRTSHWIRERRRTMGKAYFSIWQPATGL